MRLTSVIGLAVNLYLSVTVIVEEDNHQSTKEGNPKTREIWPTDVALSIEFEGEGQGSVPLDETNLVWSSVLYVLQAEARKNPALSKRRSVSQRIHLAVRNEVCAYQSSPYSPMRRSLSQWD